MRTRAVLPRRAVLHPVFAPAASLRLHSGPPRGGRASRASRPLSTAQYPLQTDGETVILAQRTPAEREAALTLAMAALPIFPLTGLVSFPGQLSPLHIYEPRYRVMLQRITQDGGHRMFGLCPSVPEELSQKPTVGTVVEVTQLRPGQDSAVILTCGVARFATQPCNPAAALTTNAFGYVQGPCQ
jgi:hypothetical protein